MSSTPKLRFKDENGENYPEWEEKKLGDLCIYKNGLTYEDKVCVDGRYDLISLNSISIDGYLKSEHKKVNYATDLLEKGDIVMILSDVAHGYFLGLTGIIPENNKYVLNQRIGLLRCTKEINQYWLHKYINYNQSYFKLHGQGSSQQNLSKGDILKFKVKSPSLPEQEKIASFLSLFDEKIELQNKKVESLKKYKKGMMQKIFSQEIRFKDENGEDYPEWKEKKIKDIFDITRGEVIAKNSLSEIQTEEYLYPVYSSQTVNYGILGYDKNFDFEGDYLTWTTDGANAGRVFKREGRFRCTNVCGLLVEKESTLGFANKTISEILNKETPKYVSYVGNPKLMNGVMGDIKIKAPSLPEQEKIASLLSIIDKKIELEEKKLEELKEYKKGLLQQMFI